MSGNDGVSRTRGSGRRRLAVVAAVAVVVVIADQFSTSWAVDRLRRGPMHVFGPLSFQLAVNTGSAFGIGRGWAPVIGALAVLVVVALVGVSRRLQSTWQALAMGLVVGGALGNLYDRVFRHFHGGVVDFIALGFWPTFNVADAGITIGVIILAWTWLVRPSHRGARSEAQADR
ncbi:signal peptidase II [Aciditerrimonas ferrireducens]|uniref:Lipoprotein signal peptidase n=1 Tax=Aciditerrimonas ferrireducens TaxID=667306 RepID=A0ABV6C1J7_9ACTN